MRESLKSLIGRAAEAFKGARFLAAGMKGLSRADMRRLERRGVLGSELKKLDMGEFVRLWFWKGP